MRFLRLFASIHNTPSLNQGSVFSLRKCQIRIPSILLPLEGSFPEKIFLIKKPDFERFFQNRNFYSYRIFAKNRNFAKNRVLLKIEIFVQNRIFECSKSKILNFC